MQEIPENNAVVIVAFLSKCFCPLSLSMWPPDVASSSTDRNAPTQKQMSLELAHLEGSQQVKGAWLGLASRYLVEALFRPLAQTWLQLWPWNSTPNVYLPPAASLDNPTENSFQFEQRPCKERSKDQTQAMAFCEQTLVRKDWLHMEHACSTRQGSPHDWSNILYATEWERGRKRECGKKNLQRETVKIQNPGMSSSTEHMHPTVSSCDLFQESLRRFTENFACI